MPRMLPLKMRRDLLRLRSQAIAIAFVIAAGLATWIISLSTLNSLQATMNGFYAEQRFADVFAQAVRAPDHLAYRIADIDGVATVSMRIEMTGRANLPGFEDSITLLASSIPDDREATLNRLYLTSGRLPYPHAAEAVISEAFAEAHSLRTGDHITAIIEGLATDIRITGFVTSPEYIYQIAPGHLFPDYQRYAVIWMRNRQMEAMADMRGAFNSVSLRLMSSANPRDVITKLDDLLAPYGGVGAYLREDQMSHLYLTEEMRQLANMAGIFPMIFLGVAVFLLAIVIGRVVRQQREEVATLKAFGYSNSTIAANYLLMVMIIVLVGCILGVIAGAWLGNGLGRLYADFFRFPYIHYSLGADVLASGILLSTLAAIFGTLRSLKAAWRLTPAEAMRPDLPERYHRSLLERFSGLRFINQTTRMILRHLSRHPVKSLFSVIGLAMAVAILMVGNFQGDAIDYMIDVQFGLASREDATVTFTHALGRDAVLEAERLDGVWRAVPFRSTAIEIRHGHRTARTGLQAYGDDTSLHRALDRNLRPIAMPRNGILLSDFHARELDVNAGDRIDITVLEGRRPHFTTSVDGIVKEYIGASAYMHIDTLNQRLLEPSRSSGVHLGADGNDRLDRELRALPGVAGVNRTEEAITSFRTTMAEMIVVFALINTVLAGVIAFGVIYNSARVALSERERELASLRVLGYTREEVAWILNGELLLLSVLALPVGFAIGYGLCWLIASSVTSELYAIPLVLEGSTYYLAALVAAVALLISLLVVRRQTFRLDLVGVLKTRE